jgi:hypothetical protein
VSRSDRAIGVALGLVAGLLALYLFLFTGGEGTVDDASLSGSGTTTTAPPKPRPPKPPRIRTVRVASGGPPGPLPNLRFRKGQVVRFKVSSEGLAIVAQVVGYGIKRSVPADRTVTLSFKARKPGEFPVVVEATHIGIARLVISRR